MNSRLDLHEELLTFIPNVYFQPPSNIRMIHPCIVYEKESKFKNFGNDNIYIDKQAYSITVIEKTPESNLADNIEKHFQYCKINQYYTFENLCHVKLSLYY